MFYLSCIAVLVGTCLLVLECFLPGIGVAGVSGGILTALGVLGLIPYMGWLVIFVITAVICVVIISVLIFAKMAQDKKNPLILNQRTDKESGFTANEDLSTLLNKSGITLSTLRPAGIALIDNQRVDVVTDGEFLKKDTKITVTDIQGRRVIVKEEI